ncbi:50S ribosomal protein L32, partial [Mycobacterium tuberculosis]
MAVPTRRKSRANTRSRRSQWRARPDGCGPNTPGGLVSADYRHRVAGEVG